MMTIAESFERLRNQIERMNLVEDNWDSYGTIKPNPLSINNAHKVLFQLEKSGNILPDKILPSAEGGIALVFSNYKNTNSEKRSIIETLNDGESYIVIYDIYGYCKTIFIDEGCIFSDESILELKDWLEWK